MSITGHYAPATAPLRRRRASTRLASPQLKRFRDAAVRPDTNVATFGRLLDFEALVAAREAKQSFDRDFAAMQTELPEIAEKGMLLTNFGREISTYARWEDINRIIKPILAKRRFSLRFQTGQEGERVRVTGRLHHIAGHVEETTLWLPVELSGGKNGVQGIGSSTSYGKRYTASALLNLISSGEDDDGVAGGQEKRISDEQAEQLRQLISAKGASEPKLLALLRANSLETIAASKYRTAVAALTAKGARK